MFRKKYTIWNKQVESKGSFDFCSVGLSFRVLESTSSCELKIASFQKKKKGDHDSSQKRRQLFSHPVSRRPKGQSFREV